MDNDDINSFDDIVLTTDTSLDNTYTTTVTIDDYTVSSIDLSDITFGTGEPDDKRVKLRQSGDIPIDIWAKLYNNNVIGNDND